MKRKIALALTMAMLGTWQDVDKQIQTQMHLQKQKILQQPQEPKQLKPQKPRRNGMARKTEKRSHFISGVVFSRNTDMTICVPTSMRNTKTKDFRWNM